VVGIQLQWRRERGSSSSSGGREAPKRGVERTTDKEEMGRVSVGVLDQEGGFSNHRRGGNLFNRFQGEPDIQRIRGGELVTTKLEEREGRRPFLIGGGRSPSRGRHILE